MRSTLLILLIGFSAAVASAQEEEPTETESAEEEEPTQVLELAPDLPAPTLEGAEPVGAAEPLPQAPEEEQPAILAHIGTGDHPEWEASDDDGELPRDIAFQTPNDARSSSAPPEGGGGGAFGTIPEEEPPQYVLAAGAGYARFLSTTALDFFRVEERFEVQLPELSGFRFGVAASQMFADQGYIVGGGARLGMGATLCDTGEIQCDGVIYLQPGFLAGLTGPRFDLNANINLRLWLFRVLSVSVEAGYSLLFDGNSLLHIGGSVGVGF